MEPDASASAGYQMVAASRRTGMGLPVLDRSLGRKQAATTQKDPHLGADPLHKAVNSIGATIDVAMGGDSDGRKVVPLLNRHG